MENNEFDRMKFHKDKSQFEDYHEYFIKEITRELQIEYGMRLSDDELRQFHKLVGLDFCTAVIAEYVNRDSKYTIGRIVTYCATHRITPENFLWRAINKYIDTIEYNQKQPVKWYQKLLNIFKRK